MRDDIMDMGKGDGEGGGWQEAKARPPQVRMLELLSDRDMDSGDEALLSGSSVRTEESGGETGREEVRQVHLKGWWSLMKRLPGSSNTPGGSARKP